MRTLLLLTTWACALGCAFGQQPAESDSRPSHDTDAKSYYELVEAKLKHTYPATALRMLLECGNIREGICVDIGCGTGHLDVELGKRSNLQIVGIDIDPEMKPFFDQQVQKAGLQDRIRFVQGDAQQLPFPDDYADIIVSRGVLIFLPDPVKCLAEVDRVLKPTGVAFLGGRYLYAPPEKKNMSAQDLERIVRESGVQGAKVIDQRGQWVKIIGPQAPEAARQVALGPAMLAARCLADYNISKGACLLICGSEGRAAEDLQQGFLEIADLSITALYPKQEFVDQAQTRIGAAHQQDRITCQLGTLDALPFPAASFDLIVGTGPMLIFSERQAAMRELHRVLRPGGCALVGGQYLHMPPARKVSNAALQADAQATGIPSIRVLDDMGQWVEIRKGLRGTDSEGQ